VVSAMHQTQHSSSVPTARCWRKREDDIDLDRGGIVEGADSVDACGERIFRLILDTASGRKTKSELHGYGQNEFVPWQLGAVM
jgi:altronate hydrolase